LTVIADVTNTGRVAGDEVAELYLMPPAGPMRPALELEAFRRVTLQPGETKSVQFQLDARQLSLVAADGNRAVVPGAYTLVVAGAQPQAAATKVSATFNINGTMTLPK